MTEYRKVRDGEYWDICSAAGFMRRVGKTDADITAFIQKERDAAKYEYESRLARIRDFELRMAENEVPREVQEN
jgi:hypothetical protein